MTSLLKEMTKIRSQVVSSIDYSQFLPWNLTPQLREEITIKTISIKKKCLIKLYSKIPLTHSHSVSVN